MSGITVKMVVEVPGWVFANPGTLSAETATLLGVSPDAGWQVVSISGEVEQRNCEQMGIKTVTLERVINLELITDGDRSRWAYTQAGAWLAGSRWRTMGDER